MARILLTGAAGMAATGLRPRLRAAGHRILLTDVRPVVDVDERCEHFVLADLRDTQQVEALLTDIDVVVHLGGHSRERPWNDILTVNIDATQKLLAAAQQAGIRRVLLASSHHVVGFAPVGSAPDSLLLPRPDTFYGVSKAAMEALGSVYADRFGMLVVALRIGTLGALPRGERTSHTWMSFDDLARLVDVVSETPLTGFHLVWGTSNNAESWFDLEPGRALGFEPVDDAQTATAGHEPDPTDVVSEVIGGRFADSEHPLGEAW